MISKQTVLMTTFFLVFTTYLFLFSIVSDERAFYTSYEEYYSSEKVFNPKVGLNEEVWQTLSNDKANLKEANFSGFNWALAYSFLLPGKYRDSLTLSSGHFFKPSEREDSVVIGKDVFKLLSKEERSRGKVKLDNEWVPIVGVLAKSPFDANVFLNPASPHFLKKYLSGVTSLSMTRYKQDKKWQQIVDKVKIPESDSGFRSPIYSLTRDEFEQGSHRFDLFYLELLLVSSLSVMMQFYQRLDAWRLELAIRKLVGASEARLVWDTFQKYLKTMTLSFILSLVVVLSGTKFMEKSLPFTFQSALLGSTQVTGVFIVMVLFFFSLSVVSVKIMTVSQLLREVRDV